ncbi:MAG: PEP-CTERM sorting domain-containing protein [Planctomycetota bacterium]|nr:PEP-CTERM sorting domain-containing protein [Planctomycetota bacterium]
MNKRLKSLRFAVAALTLGLSTVSASAAIFNPGDGGSFVGTDTITRPELGGLVLADVLRPFTITTPGGGSISGTLQDRVLQGNDGALLFETRIRDTRTVNEVTGAPGPSISVVLHGSFNSGITPTIEAEFRTDSLGTVGPDDGGRTSGTGDLVGFRFLTGLNGGTDTHFFFVRTGASSFNDQGAYKIEDFNSNSTIIPGFQPTVPEPASIALLGLPALALLRRRR